MERRHGKSGDVVTRTPRPTFWARRSVLLTGHTGFKGGWLAIWLAQMGARVTGVGLAPDTSPNLFTAANVAGCVDSRIVDVRDRAALAEIVHEVRPDIVFHLAAQPLVRESYQRPVETFATNVMGTVHLLDALRGLDGPCAAVMVTTDKVYENQESIYPYRETDTLGGHDPYAASKAACEIVIASYRKAFLRDQGIAVASARAGNVIGGGDWARDRLIPDAVRAWESGRALAIRSPEAVRPWQHVMEPLCAYLLLAEHLWADPSADDAYNFGPASGDVATVREVVSQASAIYGTGTVVFTSDVTVHEGRLLALEVAKAKAVLNIAPLWPLSRAIAHTMGWYRAFADGADAVDLCHADLTSFTLSS